MAAGKGPFGAGAKLPTHTKLPTRTASAAVRLRRLEEAKTFLRQRLAEGPQPAQRLIKAAIMLGIATRTLHRAKDGLGVRAERFGGYGSRGSWMWHPPIVEQQGCKVASEFSVMAP